eukprot:TRINITY_DN1994_c0_g1_i1.p1 TRINITY_DN1994_c0_g1~~TRINITY_DN1994_c0_g1_i1.p1  ORF type:complete len:504 (-),score=17.56 TRINITY_DN1994_c0_g1_i1:165-1601(-)
MSLSQYETQKVIVIKHRAIAVCKWAVVAMIVGYVCVWQMAMNGAHLKVLPVSGVWKSFMVSPRQNDCDTWEPDCKLNLRKSTELPYCAQSLQHYNGQKFPCQHETSDLVSDNRYYSGISVYTTLTEYQIKRECAENNTDDCTQDTLLWYPSAKSIYYADVERFNILLYHSFKTSDLAIHGPSRQFTAHIRSCSKNSGDCSTKRLKKTGLKNALYYYGPALSDKRSSSLLQRAKSAFLSNDVARRKSVRPHVPAKKRNPHVLAAPSLASSDHSSSPWSTLEEESFAGKEFSMPTSRVPEPMVDEVGGYDVLPVRDLLREAHLDLDEKTPDENRTWRELGAQLVLTITYSNAKLDASGGTQYPGLSIWPRFSDERRLRDVEYTYSVQALKDPYSTIAFEKKSDGSQIKLEHAGVLVQVELRGELLVWDWSVFLVFVGATFGLISIADTVVRNYVNFKYKEDIKTRYTADPHTGRLIEEPR